MKELGQTLSEAKLHRKIGVLGNTKNLALVIETTVGGEILECLYRPENGVRLTLDPRIPKPEEIYRDSAYTRVDRLLGWNVSLPVEPWSIDNEDKGVISPFERTGKPLNHWNYKEKLQYYADFTLKLATLDYICAVTDRAPNDILEVGNGLKVVDSGLSFVEGIDFISQNTIARDIAKDGELSRDILDDLQKLNANLENITAGLLDPHLIKWVVLRKEKLLNTGLIR